MQPNVASCTIDMPRLPMVPVWIWHTINFPVGRSTHDSISYYWMTLAFRLPAWLMNITTCFPKLDSSTREFRFWITQLYWKVNGKTLKLWWKLKLHLRSSLAPSFPSRVSWIVSNCISLLCTRRETCEVFKSRWLQLYVAIIPMCCHLPVITQHFILQRSAL